MVIIMVIKAASAQISETALLMLRLLLSSSSFPKDMRALEKETEI
jgi:hypothetical protein